MAVTGGVWTLLVVVEWLRVSPTTAVDYAYNALASIAFLPFALLLTNFVYHFAYPGETLPREPIGEEGPHVAVLYTTCNDLVPLCVERTAEAVEHPVGLWILSDSDVPEAIATDRRFDGWRRYTRGVSRGGKSGIINDWLADHGDGYEYFVTLDADTMLAPGFDRAGWRAVVVDDRSYGGSRSTSTRSGHEPCGGCGRTDRCSRFWPAATSVPERG